MFRHINSSVSTWFSVILNYSSISFIEDPKSLIFRTRTIHVHMNQTRNCYVSHLKKINMNERESEWCKNLVSSIWKWPIAIPFREPVDPVNDNAPNYFQVIPHPMDLSTVKLKIEAKSYPSVEDFLSDMRLICQNAQKYNGEESFLGMMSRDILDEINKRAKEKIREDEKENFQAMKESIAKLNKLLSDIPIQFRNTSV